MLQKTRRKKLRQYKRKRSKMSRRSYLGGGDTTKLAIRINQLSEIFKFVKNKDSCNVPYELNSITNRFKDIFAVKTRKSKTDSHGALIQIYHIHSDALKQNFKLGDENKEGIEGIYFLSPSPYPTFYYNLNNKPIIIDDIDKVDDFIYLRWIIILAINYISSAINVISNNKHMLHDLGVDAKRIIRSIIPYSNKSLQTSEIIKKIITKTNELIENIEMCILPQGMYSIPEDLKTNYKTIIADWKNKLTTMK